MSHDPSPDPSSPPGSPGPALAGLTEDPATPVVTATMSVAGFVDGWIHCQHLADYLARFAASDRFDPAQLTTRLSTYLNELLELVFRSDPPPGDFVLAIHRLPDRLQVELRCPAASERLRRSVGRVSEPNAAAAYRRDFAELARGEPGEHDPADGLLELVALHGIRLESVSAGPDLGPGTAADAVILRMTVPHE